VAEASDVEHDANDARATLGRHSVVHYNGSLSREKVDLG
jgi:hypothetical protein